MSKVPRSTLGKYWYILKNHKEGPFSTWDSIRYFHSLNKQLKKHTKEYYENQKLLMSIKPIFPPEKKK